MENLRRSTDSSHRSRLTKTQFYTIVYYWAKNTILHNCLLLSQMANGHILHTFSLNYVWKSQHKNLGKLQIARMLGLSTPGWLLSSILAICCSLALQRQPKLPQFLFIWGYPILPSFTFSRRCNSSFRSIKWGPTHSSCLESLRGASELITCSPPAPSHCLYYLPAMAMGPPLLRGDSVFCGGWEGVRKRGNQPL